MFKKGTRVIIVDEVEAESLGADVRNGEKGTIGEPRSHLGYVNVHIDGDSSPMPWVVSASCVERIRKPK